VVFLYEFESRVRYSDAMNTGALSLISIAHLFQDCATEHSDSLGKDIAFYKNIRRAWLLNSWQIDIMRYPACGETIFVATWSYGFKGLYGYRNFTLSDKNRQLCACANSVWFFMDIDHKQPVRVPEEEGNSYGHEEKLPMEYCPRKIAMPQSLTALTPYTVAYHDIDTNGHMNNSRYIELALQCLPEQLQYSPDIYRVRTEYKKAATQGSILVPYLASVPEKNGAQYAVMLADKENEPYANILFGARLPERKSS